MKEGKNGGGGGGKEESEQVLGCELLESRAVMGITGAKAERSWPGGRGPLPLAYHFYGDRGAGRTGCLSHWTLQQGKRESNNSRKKTINHGANYMFIKKKGK